MTVLISLLGLAGVLDGSKVWNSTLLELAVDLLDLAM